MVEGGAAEGVWLGRIAHEQGDIPVLADPMAPGSMDGCTPQGATFLRAVPASADTLEVFFALRVRLLRSDAALQESRKATLAVLHEVLYGAKQRAGKVGS
jgi:hypothetical protein